MFSAYCKHSSPDNSQGTERNGYDPIVGISANPLNPSLELVQYATAVKSDPVGRSCEIVAICQKSGQRREGLQKLIAAGNDTNAWGLDTTIRCVQLLRDCEMCWSSTHNMIDWLIELYPVSISQLKHVKSDSCNVLGC